MKVYGANESDVKEVVRKVSHARYFANIMVKDSRDCSNSAGPRATFTIRAFESSGAGARRTIPTPWSDGRRSIAACWHAHYDVLAQLFADFPDARVVTAWYEATRDTFEETAWETQYKSVGSLVYPVYSTELCECHAWQPLELSAR